MSSLFIYADGRSEIVQHEDDYAWERVGALRDTILPPEDADVSIYSPAGDLVAGEATWSVKGPRQLVDAKGRPVQSEQAARASAAFWRCLEGVVARPCP